MDQQGTPIGGSRSGTKVTTEPAPTILEAPGPIAADSLAADSLAADSLAADSYNADEGFSDNRDAHPSSVKGASSTFANQDSSSAKELAPAPNADAREAQEAWSETSKLKGAEGLKDLESQGAGKSDSDPDHSGSGAASETKQQQQGGKGPGEYATREGGSKHTSGENYRAGESADQAPGYVASVTGQVRSEGQLKPKGTNLHEGGFEEQDDEEGRNASFTGEIGTEQDPGRAAEQGFQRINAEGGANAGTGPRQKGIVKGGVGYEKLGSEEQL